MDFTSTKIAQIAEDKRDITDYFFEEKKIGANNYNRHTSTDNKKIIIPHPIWRCELGVHITVIKPP